MADNYYKIKEATLTEVADAIRAKTSTTDKVAVNDFATKISSITTGSGEEELISTGMTSKTEVETMLFSKTEDGNFETVTLPHSCNAKDCTISTMHRGDAFYKYILNLTEEEATYDYLLQFEQVIQSATFYLNNKEIGKHTSGYTPYALKLNGLVEGENTIIIKTNNGINYDQIPLSADFSFPNGIVGKVHLLKAKHLYLDPTVMGYDRFHINQLNVDYTNNIVDFSITAGITNSSSVDGKLLVQINIIDAEGNVKSSTTCKTLAAANSTALFDSDKIRFENVHLWNGQADPYLYNVEVKLLYNGATVDSNKIPFGFRSFEAPITSGGGMYRLNGKEIALRGVALHQDFENSATALTDENYKTDYDIIKELNCNWLRLAHYPHNIRETRDYAKLGLLAQTEIPWVNNYGTSSTQGYRDCIKQYVKDMVNNLYNLTTIAIWGISNELGNQMDPVRIESYSNLFKSDPTGSLIATDGLQVNVSYAKLQNECYLAIKKLDPSRPIGQVYATDNRTTNVSLDWRGINFYPKWYDKSLSNLYDRGKNTFRDQYKGGGAVAGGVTEYGYGMSTVYHSDIWETDYLTAGQPSDSTKYGTRNGTGGAKHPEEFGFKWHAYYYDQLMHTPSGYPALSFTTLWVLFDFACYTRKEGYIKGYNENYTEDPTKVGINDKGLITRDRQVKKDAYYFYKAVWNPEKMIHINSKYWTERTSNMLSLKIVSNCEKVEVYKNNDLIETLTTPDENTCDVVYTTTETQFYNITDNYKVIGYKKNEDGSYTEVCEDTASFTTLDTENVQNAQSFVISSVTGAKTVAAAANQFTTNITSNSDWTITVPDWVSADKLSGNGKATVTFTVENNTNTEDRTGDINVYLGSEIAATINLTQEGYVKVESISVNPTSVTIPQAGSTGTIAVTASSTYTISNNLDWVAISGSGASLTYTIDANETTSSRSGSITLTINPTTTASVKFTQEAKAETSGGGDGEAGGDSGEAGGGSDNEGGSTTIDEYTELLSLNSEPGVFGAFKDGVSAEKPYIDTELIPNVNTKVQLDITMLGASDKPAVVGSASNLMYFGSRGSNSSRNRCIIRLGQADFGNTATASLSDMVAYAGERHVYELARGVLKVDNTNMSANAPGNWDSSSTTVSMYLFGAHDGSNSGVGVKNGAPCRFYGCKVYDGTELVSDMIPVLDSKGVACVYDKVRKKFLYNKGTTAFTSTAK